MSVREETSRRERRFSRSGRGAALVTALTLAIAAVEPSTAMAASAPNGFSAHHRSSGNTDISAARRRHYHRGGSAAALAAFAGIVGTIGGIAAAQERRDYYESGPGYYGGPAYYDAPAYGYYRGYGAPDPYRYYRGGGF